MGHLRIGFDAKRAFFNTTGLGNYSRSLLHQIAQLHPHWRLHLFAPNKGIDPDAPALMQPPFQVHWGPKRGGVLWRSVGISRNVQQLGLDIYHGLSHELPRGIGLSGAIPIVSMHDVIFRHFPDQYPLFDRLVYDQKWRHSCSQAAHIIAISEATKQDLIRFYRVAPERITVIYQSCDAQYWRPISAELKEQIRTTRRLPSQYLLFVASLTVRKNLLSLIKAMALLPKEQCPPLVVVGEGATYRKQMGAFIHRNGLDGHIHFLQGVKTTELPALYAQAYALVYPSLYEGFGLPIIESLACKTPVITSEVSAMPEAAGPGGLLIDPQNPEAIAAAIATLGDSSEQRDMLVQKGYVHVQQFRPEVITHKWSTFYQELS